MCMVINRVCFKTPHFNSRHRYTHTRNDPLKKSLGPALPPPHRCRTFPLLLVQMRYGLLCVLWVWHRRTNRRPSRPPMSNLSTSPTDCTAWRFWTMRQPNGCSTPAPKSSAAKQWIKELAQKKEEPCLLKKVTWAITSSLLCSQCTYGWTRPWAPPKNPGSAYEIEV